LYKDNIMERKKEYITALAINLNQNQTRMTVGDLADNLNLNGIRTSYGTNYKGRRGTFTLIHATYDSLILESRDTEAEILAHTFVNSNGDLAWE
jgi:hypothetical protein